MYHYINHVIQCRLGSGDPGHRPGLRCNNCKILTITSINRRFSWKCEKTIAVRFAQAHSNPGSIYV